MLPTSVQAASTHYLTPYQTTSMNSYTGDVDSSFTMMGTTYYYGAAQSGLFNPAQVLYNLNGEFTSVELDIGHLDGLSANNINIYVYLDGELTYTWPLTSESAVSHKTIDTTGVTQLRFDLVGTESVHYFAYGLGNVIGYGGHIYEAETTKSATPFASGIRTYTCSVCGASYTETIPAVTYCEPSLLPYQTKQMAYYEDTGNVKQYISVMGNKYYEGVYCNYSWATDVYALYALNMKYKSITFKIGAQDNSSDSDATLYVYADGSTSSMKTVELTSDMIEQTITLDVTGVTQLKLNVYGWDAHYAIYDMSYVPVTNQSHSYTSEITLEAGYGTTGIRTYTCENCGISYTETIAALTYPISDAEITLSKTTATYTGSEIKPSVTVTYDGKTLTNGTDYSVSYSNNVSAGTATVTVTGKGNYSGTKKATFTITAEGYTYSTSTASYKVIAASSSSKTVTMTAVKDKTVTSVTIPATVTIDGTTYKVTAIADSAFANCTKLTKVTIGKYVKTIGSKAFYKCTALTTVKIPSSVKTIGASAFCKCTKLKTVTGCASVTKVGSKAFYGDSKLTTVKGMTKLATIGSKAFYKCTKLTQIGSKAKKITLAKVKTIGSSAFCGCKAITYVNLTSTQLTKINASAFQSCTALKTFVSKSTKLKTIGKKAFYGDKKLASVTLKTSKLTSSKVGASAFKGIKSTCTFKVPSAKVSSYKKIFKAKGAGSKITVKKA